MKMETSLLTFPKKLFDVLIGRREIHLESKSLLAESSSEELMVLEKTLSELNLKLELIEASRNRCDDN